jgi:hypothetical protein
MRETITLFLTKRSQSKPTITHVFFTPTVFDLLSFHVCLCKEVDYMLIFNSAWQNFNHTNYSSSVFNNFLISIIIFKAHFRTIMSETIILRVN